MFIGRSASTSPAELRRSGMDLRIHPLPLAHQAQSQFHAALRSFGGPQLRLAINMALLTELSPVLWVIRWHHWKRRGFSDFDLRTSPRATPPP